ncbi:hypothetical protein [Mucilaginibacter pedocola]|uniref:P/Homo B domain-containing protein n=1 Tax=Mucilaginibacter pedocola TaxID=1792845 RepID=A0A1S9P880_9SPHI|nr:hypothetical protein [Mucilaginibacter pedocola]OOQ57139.1 hypothetical protein BC343_16600 [Mucilaginibacter pedocola]
MDISSNQLSFATLTGDYPAVNIPSATTANTITLVATGQTHGSIITDLLFRSLDTTTRNFDIILCTTGAQTTAENAVVQVSIPASSGNTGVTSLASLASLAPALFDIDMAGNRVINLESTWSIYVKNTSATTGAFYVRAKRRNF